MLFVEGTRGEKCDKLNLLFHHYGLKLPFWTNENDIEGPAYTKTRTDQNPPGTDQNPPGTDQNPPGTDQNPPGTHQEPTRNPPV